MGGKSQFPFLVDPNTDTMMYESDAIVEYLYNKYGGGRSPPEGLVQSTLLTGWMPTLLRIGRGMVRYEAANEEPPQQMMQLYNYENNQFARLVRWRLGNMPRKNNRILEDDDKMTPPPLFLLSLVSLWAD